MDINTLKQLSSGMPCKTIPINGKPYLNRYYAGTFADGRDLWLHEFLTSDSERHVHSHPFIFRSIVLSGQYIEEREIAGMMAMVTRKAADMSDLEIITMIKSVSMLPSQYAILHGTRTTVFDWHRIADVIPGTWTAMIVEPERLPFWYFRDGDELTAVKSSPREWWL